jgi:hypothetical protein
LFDCCVSTCQEMHVMSEREDDDCTISIFLAVLRWDSGDRHWIFSHSSYSIV